MQVLMLLQARSQSYFRNGVQQERSAGTIAPHSLKCPFHANRDCIQPCQLSPNAPVTGRSGETFMMLPLQHTVLCNGGHSLLSRFFPSIKLEQCVCLQVHVCLLEERKERQSGYHENGELSFFFAVCFLAIREGPSMKVQ